MMRVGAAIAAVVLAFVAGGPLAAAEAVDLELVLAIDVSGSIDQEEAALQREGYLAALTHPQVIAAIKSGYHGRIAVSYFEWAGEHYQRLVADWAVVSDEASAKTLAETIAQQPVTTELWTSITGAIHYAMARFAASPYVAKRRVLDISGDGPNNRGGSVLQARDEAVLAGVTINGLPIINERPSRWGLPPSPNLDLYYQDCVIGGRGAFIIVADSFKEFALAIRKKLILEIADLKSAPPRLWLAQDRARPYGGWRPPCDQGEREMQKYRDR